MFKLYAALGLAVTIFLGFHIMGDRATSRKLEAARFDLNIMTASRDAWVATVKRSEQLRVIENAQAKTDLDAARKDADARVAEARRSAGAIKRIVERPREIDPDDHCPVPSVIGTDELRDALQPHPFGGAAAPLARLVPEPGPGAAPAAWSDVEPAGRGGPTDGPGGYSELPQLDLGSPGVGERAGPSAGEAGLRPRL